MTEPIKTVEEFIAWTKELQGGLFLYRGLADADWEVESSAYRRIRNSENTPAETLPAVTFQNYINQLLDDASLQGFRERQDRSLSELELLAELQHYGAATCLIDFTTSALIALYFACQEETGKAGKVVAMATDDIRAFSTIGYEDLEKPVREFLNQGKLWKWEPSGLNNRIVAQQSVFVFGEGRIEKSQYEEITIAAACKKVIIETLEKSFGIREQQLFNDLTGFAHINAHDQPYGKFSAEDFFYLGIAFHQRGEYQQAIERYDKAIEGNPQIAEAFNNRGVARADSGDNVGAIADFTEAIELNPQNAETYNNRGAAKRLTEDYKGAIVDFSRAIELNPEYAYAYNSRGLTKDNSGDQEGAIADFNKAIELDPQHADTYNNRGAVKGMSNDHQGAIADFSKAIELNPQFAAAYYNRGFVRGNSGDYQAAIADYDKAIEHNPMYVAAFTNRGIAKGASGDYSGAIVDFNRAIELDPQFAAAFHNRGMAKRTLGDEAGAQNDFAKANEIDSRFSPPDP